MTDQERGVILDYGEAQIRKHAAKLIILGVFVDVIKVTAKDGKQKLIYVSEKDVAKLDPQDINVGLSSLELIKFNATYPGSEVESYVLLTSELEKYKKEHEGEYQSLKQETD